MCLCLGLESIYLYKRVWKEKRFFLLCVHVQSVMRVIVPLRGYCVLVSEFGVIDGELCGV